MSAKTFGTFRRETKTAASRPDEWPGDELSNCVVCEQHDFAASTQSVVYGLTINLSIYMSICVCINLCICLSVYLIRKAISNIKSRLKSLNVLFKTCMSFLYSLTLSYKISDRVCMWLIGRCFTGGIHRKFVEQNLA